MDLYIKLQMVLFIVFMCGPNFGQCSRQHELLDYLRYDHRDTARFKPESTADPVTGTEKPLVVKVGVNLVNIIAADETTNTVDCVIWLLQSWQTNIKWRDARDGQFRNITKVNVCPREVWTPDLTIYNQVSAPEYFLSERMRQFVLHSNGTAVYIPAMKVRTACDLANIDFDDSVECQLRMGSWVYNAQELDVQLYTPRSSGVDLSFYLAGSIYEVVHTSAERNVQRYSCCSEPYAELRFNVTFRKKRVQKESSYFSLF